MARNEEKSQSMLYRFREVQAAELGLSRGKGDRRPRLASSCTTLRECERWRGEILREISRKVSKIQDAGLTDYEIRDINDEINKLMREKGHWERQIQNLGGANYKRSGAMLDEDGKEVPGTRGYKYFGRARELPGVKEMFAKSTVDKDEDTIRAELYKRFRHQGPAYYGDMDEADGAVLADEAELEEKEWNAACTRLSTRLNLASTSALPPIPRPSNPSGSSISGPSASVDVTASNASKRSAPDDASPNEGDSSMASPSAKEAKLSSDSVSASNSTPVEGLTAKVGEPASSLPAVAAVAAAQQQATAYIALNVLKREDLEPPKLPSQKEMEAALLVMRKKMLLDQYGI